MQIHRSTRVAFALAAAALWMPLVLAQEPAAVVTMVQGRVELTSARGTRVLDPGRDLYIPLFGGDRLQCTAGATVELFENGRSHIPKQCGSGGYTVPPPAPAFAAALKSYGRTGGLPRGGFAGFVLWPVEGVRTRPQTAARLQWQPQATGELTVTLRAAAPPRVLWTRGSIDAASGAFHDADLESALAEAAATGELTPVLEVRPASGPSSVVPISLLGGAEERALIARLAAVGAGAPEAVAHLLRANVLLDAGLQREALDEYLAVTARAPNAAFLLEQAAALAGALADPRAADLRNRAAAAKPSP